jgi:hypothetical protein
LAGQAEAAVAAAFGTLAAATVVEAAAPVVISIATATVSDAIGRRVRSMPVRRPPEIGGR